MLETREHLYLNCTEVQRAKALAEQEIERLTLKSDTMTRDLILLLDSDILEKRAMRGKILKVMSHYLYAIWRTRAKVLAGEIEEEIAVVITGLFQAMMGT